MIAGKKSRQSKPKVRSGCITCKTRRIKCDEQRPECLRCIRSGRHCDGYRDAPGPSPAGTIEIYSIPFKVPGSQADRQLLQFYCSEVAENISQFSDPTLWTQLILQRCQHHSVVRNALVTLSSLYQDHLCDGSLRISPKNIHAISKCHRQLRIYLLSPNASPEVALICSLIFYTFECLVGDTKQAIWHLDQGLTLLRRVPADYPHLLTASDGIFTHLTTIFSHLDIQASTYHCDRKPILDFPPLDVPAGMVVPIPDDFISPSHAEEALTMLQNGMMHHIIAHVEHKDKRWDELPPSILDERLRLQAQFRRFGDAAGKLADRIKQQSECKPQCVNMQRGRILLSQIQAQVFHGILLENIPLPTNVESTSAEIDRHLDSALSHIFALVSVAKESFPSTGRSFTLSTLLVAALYHICMKTRNLHTLQAALSLLQEPALPLRDGLWNTKTATFVVQTMLSYPGPCGNVLRMESRLEDAGSGIVDVGGLDEAFRILQITKPNYQETLLS